MFRVSQHPSSGVLKAVTATCRVTLQWINIGILLHLVGFLLTLHICMFESSTTYSVAQWRWKANPSCISIAKLDSFILLTDASRSTTVQREHNITYLCVAIASLPQCYIIHALPLLFDVMWRIYVGRLDDRHLADVVEHGLVRWKVELFVCWERCKPAPSVLHRDSCDELSGNISMSLAFILLCSVYKDIKYENALRS